MRNQQSGFTLVELIIVIVILGVLSAFALPRFADLGADAREASLSGLAGSLKSAAAIARSSQLASGATLGTSVILDGTTVTMVNGYPQAIAAGIVAAVGVTTSDYTTSAGGTAGGSTITFQPVSGGSSTCQVAYTAATAATPNVAPITAPISVVVTATGC